MRDIARALVDLTGIVPDSGARDLLEAYRRMLARMRADAVQAWALREAFYA
jgi:hypothetical protein